MLTLHPGPRRPLAGLIWVGLALAGLPAAADLPTVDVTVDSAPGSTRIVLTHSRQVAYLVESSRGRVRVRYAEDVDLRPPDARFDQRILERYRLRDGNTVSLETGPDFERHETFELRNPFRLVIDLTAASTAAAEKPSRRERREPQTIIVIDPGHGGVEHGAVGPTGLQEKDVTLELALRLKHQLERSRRRIAVVLTRDEDRLLALDERTAIANHNRADLFLSIHVNASPRSEATGAETYYLSSEATDEEARILAGLENRAAERDSSGRGEPSPTIDLVLWDLAQNQFLAESSALADAVQLHMNRLTATRNRGVRQAPFRVLMGAMMPAVLVEVGFISNPAEEELLRSSGYRDRVVSALAAAVEEFLFNLERLSAPRSPGAEATQP